MRKPGLFMLIAVMAASLACAQPSSQVDTVLTFRKAVQIALRNNATLNAERNNLLERRAYKTSSMVNLGPRASISASVARSNGNSFIQQEATVVNATVDGAQASFNANQPIFGGFGRMNVAKASREMYDAKLEEVNRTSQDVINLVATRFLQVLLDQELLKIAQENLELQKAQYEQTKTQVELGARSPVDEYNQLAVVSNAELRVAQAEYQLTVDKTSLFQALLIDPTTVTRIEEPQWDVNLIAIDNPNREQLIDQALQMRGDLKQVRHLQEGSRFFKKASRSGYFPTLSAFYNNGSAYNQLKGADKTAPSYRSFEEQFGTDNRFNSYGLSLNIPIFSGFQSRYSAVQNRVLYENSKILTATTENAVKADVLLAYENFQNVKKAYAAGLTGLEASKAAYDLEQERFNLGITTFVDFANANRTYVQAQTDMAQAKYRFLFQSIMLDYAMGTLKPETLP